MIALVCGLKYLIISYFYTIHGRSGQNNGSRTNRTACSISTAQPVIWNNVSDDTESTKMVVDCDKR